VAIVFPFTSYNTGNILLGSTGLLIILSSMAWWHWFGPFQKIVFIHFPEIMACGPIAPTEKSVFKLVVPKKIRMGDSVTITAEFYSYGVIFPFFDVSDTILKKLIGEREHPKYEINLQTPSFKFSPQGKVPAIVSNDSPLKWKWVIEPTSLGKKELMLYINEQLFKEITAKEPHFENPIVIPVEVVSEIGLSPRFFYWIKAGAILVGFVFGLPFLIPFFRAIGEKIVTLLK